MKSAPNIFLPDLYFRLLSRRRYIGAHIPISFPASSLLALLRRLGGVGNLAGLRAGLLYSLAPSGVGVCLRYPHATYPPLPQGGGVDRAVSLFLRGETAAVSF